MAVVNKIAVLIDGDNAESNLIEHILAEAGKFGKVTIKRIYGDWTDHRMRTWKDQLNKFAIRPMQKFSYTSRKNSTDTALIIEAMDLLHSKYVNGFCIVSSDSDYTGLAHRIREEGLFVMGIGRSHTPEAFVKACENFTYTEILTPSKRINTNKKEDEKANTTEKKNTNPEDFKGRIDQIKLIGSLTESGLKPIDLEQIDSAFNMVVNDDTGLALLSVLSSALKRLDPTFDSRNFGFYSFRKFCESLAPNYIVVKHEDGMTYSLKKVEQ